MHHVIPVILGNAPIVSDGFNRADTTVSLGNTNTGQAWQNIGGSTWGISGNLAYCPTLATTGVACVESNRSNGLLSTSIKYAGNDGIVFRLTDVNNYITVRLNPAGMAIIKIVATVATTLGNYAFSPVSGTTYNLKVQMQGSTIQVFIDGALQITISETFNQSATQVGLREGSLGGFFDNFLMEAL